MTPRAVIGVAGRARAGKDSVAEAILRMGGGVYRYSFADPMRAMVKAGFGVDATDEFWQRHKEDACTVFRGRSLRYVMQTLGTEWGRDFIDPEIWVSLAADTLSVRGPGMVIADCRFPNEAAWIRQAGGLLIHVVRPDGPGVRAHLSEAGIARDVRDPLIVNDGSLKELYEAVFDVLHGSPTVWDR